MRTHTQARKSHIIGTVVICPIGITQHTAKSTLTTTLCAAHGTLVIAVMKSGVHGLTPLIANGRSNGGIVTIDKEAKPSNFFMRQVQR
jgi:hypothetical protein